MNTNIISISVLVGILSAISMMALNETNDPAVNLFIGFIGGFFISAVLLLIFS